MCKIPKSPAARASFMKVLITYEDIASVARANASHQDPVQFADGCLSGKATEIAHGATRKSEPRSLVLADCRHS